MDDGQPWFPGTLAQDLAGLVGLAELGDSKMRLANHFKDINSRKCFNQFCAARAQYKFNLTHKLLAQPKGLGLPLLYMSLSLLLSHLYAITQTTERRGSTVQYSEAWQPESESETENRTRPGQAQDGGAQAHKGLAERRTKKGQRNGNV